MEAGKQNYLKLNSGYDMPQLGMGTWQIKPDQVEAAVDFAFRVGFRHFDCALIYDNQPDIGRVFGKILLEGKIKRQDFFVTSKIWNTYHSFDRASECLDKTLKDLQLDYLDMCLIHWPMGFQEGGELFPKNEDGKTPYSDVDYLETWKAMEQAVDAGKIKSIGLSNFNASQIQRVLDNCRIKPSNLQIEIHPYFNQTKLIQFCQQRGIVVSGYCPLASPATTLFRKPGDSSIFDEPTLKDLAEKYSKTVGQIVLRWAVQRNTIPVPKAVHPDHIRQNFEIWDFVLTDQDMKSVDGLNKNWRMIALEWHTENPYYPFKADLC